MEDRKGNLRIAWDWFGQITRFKTLLDWTVTYVLMPLSGGALMTFLASIMWGNPWVWIFVCIATPCAAIWIAVGVQWLMNQRRISQLIHSDLVVVFDSDRDRISSPPGDSNGVIFCVRVRNGGKKPLTGVKVQIAEIETKQSNALKKGIIQRMQGLTLETMQTAVTEFGLPEFEITLQIGEERQFAVAAGGKGREEIRFMHAHYSPPNHDYHKPATIAAGKYTVCLRAVCGEASTVEKRYEIKQNNQTFNFSPLDR